MDEVQARNRAGNLLKTQKLAVLATNKNGHPYSSLVAIAATADLKCLVFCTSRTTTKYKNIIIDPRVSVLLDDRTNIESNFENAMALTALGTAHEIEDTDRDERANLYLEKHSNLADFVNSPDSALIQVDVMEYRLSGFTQVWILQLG